MRSWIEKQRSILDFTLSSLLRRKGKNISLFVVYTLVVFILASAMFFTAGDEAGGLAHPERRSGNGRPAAC